MPGETPGLGNKLCFKNACVHAKSQRIMNMKQEQKAALKTQIELINFGNEINQAAELWKLRLQKQIFPDGPEVSRQLVAQLYADYHRWVS